MSPVHELAICQALAARLEALERPPGAAVRRVRVGVGPLSGVDAALLAHAYPLACAGGIARGSRLEIEQPPVKVRCRSCGTESTVPPNRLLCGSCGEWRTELVSGDELLLLAVEFESSARQPGAADV
jgi:hydrogenase nickel incorporation protein HypA/HybF